MTWVLAGGSVEAFRNGAAEGLQPALQAPSRRVARRRQDDPDLSRSLEALDPPDKHIARHADCVSVYGDGSDAGAQGSGSGE